jgi:hypothetical protein
MMGLLTLEDLTGQIEGLVFPRIYEKYAYLLSEDELVIAEGKLSFREEEEPKLLVDSVRPLNEETVAQGVKPKAQKEYGRFGKPRGGFGAGSAAKAAPAPAQPMAAETPVRKAAAAEAPKPAAADAAGTVIPGTAKASPAAPGKTDAQLAKDAEKRLYLLLPSRAHMDTVKRLCNAYPGDVPVYVKLQDEGIALLLSRDSWCAAGSDMLTACRELYGEGGVVVR